MISSYALMLWLHIAVMGYWLGSDLVVNQLTHYFKNARDMSVEQRMKLWDFLMLVDQHPRNGLILSLPLGFTLAAQLDLSPVKGPWLVALWVFSIVWFVYIWILHFQLGTPRYLPMRRLDYSIRYALIAILFVTGVASVVGDGPYVAKWLGVKVALVALMIACGVGIRHYIAVAVRAIPTYRARGPSPEVEAAFTRGMNNGSYVLYVLWTLMIIVSYLGAAKPF